MKIFWNRKISIDFSEFFRPLPFKSSINFKLKQIYKLFIGTRKEI